jgi:hypothetical protein
MENRMHDETERRRRGRPKGSTRYAQLDAAILRQVADLLIRDGRLSTTAAIKQATGKPSDDTLIHRLRGKMRTNMEHHLAEARARAAHHERARQARAVELEGIVTSVAQAWKETNAAFAQALGSPGGRAFLANVLAVNLAVKDIAGRIEQSGIRQWVAEWTRQAEQSGAWQWMRDVQRTIQTDSFAARVRKLEQSGAFQLAPDAQALIQSDSFARRAQEYHRALASWGQGKPL